MPFLCHQIDTHFSGCLEITFEGNSGYDVIEVKEIGFLKRDHIKERERKFMQLCHCCQVWTMKIKMLGYTTNSPQAPEDNEEKIWAAHVIGELLTSGPLRIHPMNGTIPAVLNFLIAKRIKRDGIRALAQLIK